MVKDALWASGRISFQRVPVHLPRAVCSSGHKHSYKNAEVHAPRFDSRGSLVDEVRHRTAELGLRYLVGETLPQNSRMRRLLNEVGQCEWHYEYGAAGFRLALENHELATG